MQRMASTPGMLQKDVQHVLASGGAESANGAAGSMAALRQNTELVRAMGQSRRASSMQRKLATNSDVALAIPRFYDPLEFWDLSGLPWNMADEGHRHKLHKWLRLYYATHTLVPILIDIFTRFPLVGMEFYCKDKKITEFYEELFFDRLDYEEFLVKLGREYWTIGEAFPLASFNEQLGVWEREELINPEDIVIENFPLLGTSQMKVVPPEYMKRLAQNKQPSDQYKQLEINFPELIPYLKRGEPFPVDSSLLKQVAFKITDWDDHGTPLLLRGLRMLLHEEKLLASQDAIAERLYSPLILAKIGTNQLGQNDYWIPGPEVLESFRDDMDIALSMDFRLLVYHWAVEIQNVFGREQVPNLNDDFDRIDRKLMMAFGINPSLLSAGQNAQPYASSALQAEFMNQMLWTYQNFLKAHIDDRMKMVAEAQGHYDYEKRGQTRVPIMEEVVEFDEDGDPHIVEKNKLLVPETNFASLDLRDEATERQFLQVLRTMGVPISDERMMVGVDFDFVDSLDEMSEEMIQKTVAQQMAKLQTYKICMEQGLPVPPALKAEVESVGAPTGGDPSAMGGTPADVGAPMPGGPGGTVMPEAPPGVGGPPPPDILGGGAPTPPGVVGPQAPGPPGAAPQVSGERRPGMPMAAKVASLILAGEGDPDSDAAKEAVVEIDRANEGLREELNKIEARKVAKRIDSGKMRRIAARVFPDDGSMLDWDRDRKNWIRTSKVPPKFKREYNEDLS